MYGHNVTAMQGKQSTPARNLCGETRHVSCRRGCPDGRTLPRLVSGGGGGGRTSIETRRKPLQLSDHLFLSFYLEIGSSQSSTSDGSWTREGVGTVGVDGMQPRSGRVTGSRHHQLAYRGRRWRQLLLFERHMGIYETWRRSVARKRSNDSKVIYAARDMPPSPESRNTMCVVVPQRRRRHLSEIRSTYLSFPPCQPGAPSLRMAGC